MPGVGLARRHIDDGRRRLVDGQVERNHAVATAGVGQGVGRVVGRSGIGGTVPVVAYASSHRFNTGVAVTEGQTEGLDAVAANGVGDGVLSHSRGGVGNVVGRPGVGVASANHIFASSAVAESEVECDDAVAAVSVSVNHSSGLVGQIIVGLSIERPGVAVASVSQEGGSRSIIDGQVQLVDAVADVVESTHNGIEVDTRLGEGVTTPVIGDAGSDVADADSVGATFLPNTVENDIAIHREDITLDEHRHRVGSIQRPASEAEAEGHVAVGDDGVGLVSADARSGHTAGWLA